MLTCYHRYIVQPVHIPHILVEILSVDYLELVMHTSRSGIHVQQYLDPGIAWYCLV